MKHYLIYPLQCSTLTVSCSVCGAPVVGTGRKLHLSCKSQWLPSRELTTVEKPIRWPAMEHARAVHSATGALRPSTRRRYKRSQMVSFLALHNRSITDPPTDRPSRLADPSIPFNPAFYTNANIIAHWLLVNSQWLSTDERLITAHFNFKCHSSDLLL